MGDVVKLEDYRIGYSLEEDYQKFLVHVNKYNGIPTNTMELCQCFYNIKILNPLFLLKLIYMTP